MLFDGPPGPETLIWRIPVVIRREAGILAESSVGLSSLVASFSESRSTSEAEVKSDPVSVIFNAGERAKTALGDTTTRAGAEAPAHSGRCPKPRNSKAASMWRISAGV